MPFAHESVPPPNHANVVPSDANVFNPPFRALVIGGAGDVVVTSFHGVDATYKCVAGQMLVIVGTKVKATGTTATNIVAQF